MNHRAETHRNAPSTKVLVGSTPTHISGSAPIEGKSSDLPILLRASKLRTRERRLRLTPFILTLIFELQIEANQNSQLGWFGTCRVCTRRNAPNAGTVARHAQDTRRAKSASTCAIRTLRTYGGFTSTSWLLVISYHLDPSVNGSAQLSSHN